MGADASAAQESEAARLAALPLAERIAAVDALDKQHQAGLRDDWRFWARPSQLAPAGDWRVWLLLAGRGFGKTRAGAEWIAAQVAAGTARRIALVAPTAADARAVMVEGESGLLAIARGDPPAFESSLRRLVWPNGAVATLYSADEPDRLRGPQFDAAWCDELAAWRYPQQAWDMLMLALRLGMNPRAVATTTPKPIALIRALLASPDCAVTRGTTRENAKNLAPGFLAAMRRQYEGTRLGRQELEAELIDEAPGALWTRAAIERARVAAAPSLRRVVVAIDPASGASEGDETGIVVAALGQDGRGYVLDDLSCRARPQDWAQRAIAAYHAHRADRIVAEENFGGSMVEAMLRVVDASAAYRPVRASRGKLARAEPVAALYEQGRVHHVGAFPALEDQMCAFAGAGFGNAGFGLAAHDRRSASPDRVDALVWALTELMIADLEPAILAYYRALSAGAS